MRFAQRAPTGNYYLLVLDVVSGDVFDWDDDTWKAIADVTTPNVAMTAETIGVGKFYVADVALDRLCVDAEPRDVSIIMFQRVGGSADPDTDPQRGEAFARICCGYEVPADDASTPFTVDVTANISNVGGGSMHLTAELVHNGKTIPLATLDPDATCAFAVTQDAVTTGANRPSQFTVSAGTVGDANSSSRFEAEYANPNLDAARCFTAVATLIAGGKTYVGNCKFTTF